MIIEKIVGPDGCVIFDIWKTDYFQEKTYEKRNDAKLLQKEKEEKERKEESSRFRSFIAPIVKINKLFPKKQFMILLKENILILGE